MKVYVKRYEELTKDELYALVKLRIAVFIVEQNCPYMELDDWDQAAVHVWLEDDEGIEAYLRVMDRGVESEHVSIGRVIAVKRRSGIGTQVLFEGIRVAKEYFAADQIYLEAQVYAKSFYEKSRFHQVSGEFLEDGIDDWTSYRLTGNTLDAMSK